jgi:uncharacterized protein YjbJ (UPF0337 family)
MGTAAAERPLSFVRQALEARRWPGPKDKIKGSVKETVSKATGDRRTEAEGKTDRAKGHVKDAVQDVKETAKGCSGQPEEGGKGGTSTAARVERSARNRAHQVGQGSGP